MSMLLGNVCGWGCPWCFVDLVVGCGNWVEGKLVLSLIVVIIAVVLAVIAIHTALKSLYS